MMDYGAEFEKEVNACQKYTNRGDYFEAFSRWLIASLLPPVVRPFAGIATRAGG